MGHEPEQPDKPAGPAKRTGGIWLIAALIAIALCCGGAVLKQALGGNSGDSGGDSGGAIAFCEQLVKDRLISPGSAKFTGEQLDQAGSVYTLTGSVDAQNTFGALLRTDFTCKADNSTGRWTVLSLTGV